MNFRDRNYMVTSSSAESLKGAAFEMLGILRGKRVPTPHAELVAVAHRWDTSTYRKTYCADGIKVPVQQVELSNNQ